MLDNCGSLGIDIAACSPPRDTRDVMQNLCSQDARFMHGLAIVRSLP